jgi:glucose/arabinose dehydrogenase
VSRFGVDSNGRADPASEKVLLRQHQPETNFNGGMLAFGRDGYLYIGLGTGGTAPELQENSQTMGSLLGKILRIDVDRGDPYAVPPDNPFVNRPDARPEVWAFGLRNPYRFSFDRETGDLYIGGPGEFKREWVNFFPGGNAGGRNFGWPILEGDLCRTTPSACSNPAIERPIIAYDSYAQGNCVVIGGYVYRGQRHPSLSGVYFYGDYCSGRVWMAGRDRSGEWKHTEGARVGSLLSSFGEDDAGDVYVTDIEKGNIYRIVAAGS